MKQTIKKRKLTPKQKKLALEKKLKDIKGKPFYKLSKSSERLFTVVLPRTVDWLQANFTIKLIAKSYEYKLLISTISETFKSRGEIEGIKWIKEVRLAFMKYLEGKPFKSSESSVRLDLQGLPVIFPQAIKDATIAGSIGDLKIILTILNSTRALSFGKGCDLEPIIKPLNKGESYDSLIKDFEKYASLFWKTLGHQWSLGDTWVPRSLRRLNYHFTTKTGPNGHALWTALLDLIAIKDTCIFPALKILVGPKFSVIETLVKFLDLLKVLFPEWFISKSVQKFGIRARKISYFPDKELKVRVIAIGDYFSQAILKPFHAFLFKVLKTIPQDHTHNQGGFKTLMVETKSTDSFWSADLSAATDRFPIEVICTVLKGRLPSSWVEAWRTVMVGLPFSSEGGEVSYEVGNPMGFYSSWASFAISHHFIIFYICQKYGIYWKTLEYALLGDDIVIKHDKVAKEYIRIMGILGVEVSVLKTHVSPNFFEFAKRLFYKGEEISPFPISALQAIHNKYYLLVSLLVELEEKGWRPLVSIPVSVGKFAETVLHRKAKNCQSWEEMSWGVEHIIKVMRGISSGGVFMTEYAAKVGFPQFKLKPFSDQEADAMLSNIAVELFSTSNPSSKEFQEKSKVPLGELATSWVLRLTNLTNSDDVEVAMAAFDLIYAIPQVRGYGTIEETYMRLIREARRIDTVEAGNWPKILRTMALPLDDNIFIQRTSHMISKGAALLTKHLTPRMEMIAMYPQLRA